MPKKSTENQRAREGAYRFGEFDLYPSERRLHRRQKAVPLPPKAFDALLLLVRNAERLVRRDALIEALWPDTFVTDANLTNVIVSLRKILGREAIQTVSKFGYRFSMPVLGEPGIDQAMYATFLQAKSGFRIMASAPRSGCAQIPPRAWRQAADRSRSREAGHRPPSPATGTWSR